jgi:tetratricopeptide (TPR) repeat protein
MSNSPTHRAGLRHVLTLATIVGAASLVGCESTGGNQQHAGNGHAEPILGGVDVDPNKPLSAETYVAAGRFAESKGQGDKAVEQYQRALQSQPGNKTAIYRIAVIRTQQRDWPRAIEAWKGYVAATNYSAGAWSNLGYCYEAAGQIAEAEDAYRQGIAKEPKHQACRVNFGLMLLRQQRFIEGKEQLATVLPQHAVLYNMGSVYEQLGRADDAKSCYQQAITLEPNFADARKRLDALGAKQAGATGETPRAGVAETTLPAN